MSQWMPACFCVGGVYVCFVDLSDCIYLKVMNRIIRFRGKRADNGEWVYGFYYQYKTIGSDRIIHYIKNEYSDAYPVVEETVGQFTGLYDKNGKEIYEGDIIRAATTHGNVIGEYTVERSEGIKWNYNGFELKVIIGREYGKFANFHPENIWFSVDTPANRDEVIGNIHDNPELL